MTTRVTLPTRVTEGRTQEVVTVENLVAGTYRYVIGMDTDAVLSSLCVTTVNSGTLDISAITYSGEYTETKTADCLTFPTISAPTDLILKKGVNLMSWLEFIVVCTGTVSFELYVKGISSGETTVRISGSDNAASSQTTIGTSPQLIIPVSLTDRSGLIIKNWTSGGILYIGFTPSEASSASGYPLVYGESMGMDLSGGATLYGVGTVPIDVRILQSGG